MLTLKVQDQKTGVWHLLTSMYGQETKTLDLSNYDETKVTFTFGVNGGLIIGCSNLNDGELCAYDITCPNCLNDGIYKTLQWDKSGNWVKCPKCGRGYDLNNNGYVVSGESGDKLLRYRASYDGTYLFIGN